MKYFKVYYFEKQNCRLSSSRAGREKSVDKLSVRIVRLWCKDSKALGDYVASFPCPSAVGASVQKISNSSKFPSLACVEPKLSAGPPASPLDRLHLWRLLRMCSSHPERHLALGASRTPLLGPPSTEDSVQPLRSVGLTLSILTRQRLH